MIVKIVSSVYYNEVMIVYLPSIWVHLYILTVSGNEAIEGSSYAKRLEVLEYAQRLYERYKI